jgi:hypothetical protein
MRRLCAGIMASAVLITVGAPVSVSEQVAVNGAPAVAPSVREWQGGVGRWQLTPATRIVLNSNGLQEIGDQFGADLAAMTGFRARVLVGTPVDGDIALVTGTAASEAYTLEIDRVVRVRGDGTSGVVHGSQVLLQLFALDPTRASVPKGTARDWPEFAERGQMIDVGRKYFPVPYLEAQIRRMAWLRLNTLHLHLSDWNGFRFRSDVFPGLASPEAYSKQELRQLQDYARRYGVTIVPEIDLPAHATHISRFDPALAFACPSMGNGYTLDVTKPYTRQFVRQLLDEVMSVFDGPYLHVGGDEWPYDAEKRACPELMAYAAQRGYPEPGDVFVEFINEVNTQIKAKGRKTRLWEWWDFNGQRTTIVPDKDITIDVWLGGPESKAAQGYQVVGTDSAALYVTPGGGLFVASEAVYERHSFATGPNIRGYKISRWSDNAEQQPVPWFDFFSLRPLQVLAERTWGGPRSATAPQFFRRVDASGEPPSRLTAVPATLVRTDSEEVTAENGRAANAFDADPRTMWHSGYSGGVAPVPHEVDADLGAVTRLGGVRYLPRQDIGVNGRVGGYEVLSSMDGTQWTLAARGSFADDRIPTQVEFAPRLARFIRFRATSEVAGRPFISAAEITPLQAASQATPALAPTPPMGFNNWAQYRCDINEGLFTNTADALVRTGLAAKGYGTVTVDDCWMTRNRDGNGNLVTDPAKFPRGMQWLGNYFHDRNLKFGIYEDSGTLTCEGYPGSLGHFAQDTAKYVEFGVDFLKLDGCFMDTPPGKTKEQFYRETYAEQSRLLAESGRQITFSMSAPAYFFIGQADIRDWYTVLEWAPQLGHLWRVGHDINLASLPNRWESLVFNYNYTWPLARFGGPNGWNDPDFLIPGPTLSADEERSQMALWSMMAAPLILSTDVGALTAEELAIVGNTDVIAVDQDRLGEPGTVVSRDAVKDILVRPLQNGDRAVAVFNRGESPISVNVPVTTAGFTAPAGCSYSVKNLWTGQTSGAISATVPRHGTAIFRVTPAAGCGDARPTGQITGGSGRCVDNFNSSTADQNVIQLWDCQGESNQRWSVQPDGTLRVQGKCLDVPGGSTTAGAPVQLFTCHGQTNQQWTYRTNGNLVNVKSGMCLDVPGGSTASGTRLQIWPCGYNQPNQIWTLPT